MFNLTSKKICHAIVCGLFCLGLGMLSGYISKAGHSVWYANLPKPSFTPPKEAFAPVWTILYLMIGVALSRLWLARHRNKILLWLFAIQFILNLAWSPIFFYFHNIGLALIDLFLIWMCLIAFVFFSFRDKVMFALFIPYLLWTSLALSLNCVIYFTK